VGREELYGTEPGTDPYLFTKERHTILNSLDPEDQITHMARQRRISGDVISPSVIITTSKKLIIVNRKMAGLKSHIKFVPYEDIGGVRIAHGMLVSSIFVRMNASFKEPRPLMEVENGDAEIKALDTKDADILFTQLNNVVNGKANAASKDSHYHMHGNVTNNIYVEKNLPQAEAGDRGIGVQTKNGQNGSGYYSDFVSLHRFGKNDREAGAAPVPIVSKPKMQEQPAISLAQTLEKGNMGAQRVEAGDLLIFKNRKQKSASILSRLSSAVNRNAN
jgi:hypothetical protein